MNTKYLTSLVLLVVACSGGQTTGGDNGGQSQAQLKKAAADAKAKGSAKGDACQEHAWYGDGECDRFCQDVDSVDCTPSEGGGIVCAEFIETPNGFCSRVANDPCIGQDPDCAGVDPLPPEPPGDPIVCPAIALEADGVCASYDPQNPCLFYEDPDCAAVDPLPPGTPSDPGTPACKVAPEPADGVCSREPSDPCLAADPDCAVACAEYIELPDGVCKRDPTDPCIFQDPDCHVK